MRKVSFFLLLIAFFATSCNAKRQHNLESTTTKLDNVASTEKTAEFLNLFKTIDPRGLHVYPPTWNKNGKLNSTPFEGVIMMRRGRSPLHKLNGTPGRSSVYRKNSIRYYFVML